MYWEANGDVHNTMVSGAMSRNRFSEILSNIHFANNSNLDQNDKFAKVRPLIDSINASCLANFQPEQFVSVDESMIPYFGRHGAKQYIHGKPIKFGYKMWVAATRLGYVINFYPYQGAGTTDKDLGLGGSVVFNLTKQLPKVNGCAYHIVFDNLFTSPRLLRLLADEGMAATGTLRLNRTEGAPLKSIEVMNKQSRGSYDVVLDSKAKVCVVRWHDSKVVTVTSTYTGVKPLQKAKRFSSMQKQRVEVDQPNVVKLYNYGMGGVDRFDQNVACYMIQHRSKKWYWPIFRFCVDLAVQNAFQLYRLQERSAGARDHDLLSFRREIAQVYVQKLSTRGPELPFPSSRIQADRRVLPEVRTDGFDHWIIQGTQRRCMAPGCKGTPVFACEKCKVGLHPGCVKEFHCK
jgi:DNA excision repair protein ERCC-6